MSLLDKYYAFVLDGAKIEPAEEVTFKIVYDFSSRKGLDHAWDAIDDEIKEEILQDWVDIVKQAFS